VVEFLAGELALLDEDHPVLVMSVFQDGGWLVPFMDERAGEIVAEQFASADAFLLGRGTYEIFAGCRPHVTDPDDVVAAALNHRPKHVVSTTLRTPDWAGTTVIGDDVVDRIRQLKAQAGRDLQVHGSHGLAQTLIRHRLVDEYRIWVFPVVLGHGKRLFGDGTVPTTFVQADTRATTTGVLVHTYRPAGLPGHGAFDVSSQGSQTSHVSAG